MAALALPFVALPVVGQEPMQSSQPPPTGIRRDFVLDLPEGPPLAGVELDAVTEEIADRIRCPQCQGLSVADSPSNTARAMKAEVRGMIAEGYSEEQILRYFEASYGEFIRLEPKVEGFNLVVWLAPIVVFGLGLLFVALRMRATNAAVEEDEGAKEAVEDDGLEAYRDRVRKEMAS